MTDEATSEGATPDSFLERYDRGDFFLIRAIWEVFWSGPRFDLQNSLPRIAQNIATQEEGHLLDLRDDPHYEVPSIILKRKSVACYVNRISARIACGATSLAENSESITFASMDAYRKILADHLPGGKKYNAVRGVKAAKKASPFTKNEGNKLGCRLLYGVKPTERIRAFDRRNLFNADWLEGFASERTCKLYNLSVHLGPDRQSERDGDATTLLKFGLSEFELVEETDSEIERVLKIPHCVTIDLTRQYHEKVELTNLKHAQQTQEFFEQHVKSLFDTTWEENK